MTAPATAAVGAFQYAHASCAQWRPDRQRTSADWIAQHRVIPVFIIPDHRSLSPQAEIDEPVAVTKPPAAATLSEWLA